MIKAALKAGAIGGIIGGVMMAVWLMFILWLIGTGFWTLLNLITNTVWRSAPLGSKFSLTSVIIGLVVHVVVSFIFGSLIVLAAWRLPGPRSLIIASGALFGPVIWLVMQFGIWHAVDPAAAQVITPWVFAVAHLIFGVLAAATAAIIASDEKHSAASTQLTVADPLSPPAHAAGQQAALGAGRHAVHDARRRSAGPAGPAPRMAPEPPAALAAGPPPPDPAAPRSGPVWHRRRLTARNVGGLRTVVYTSGGPGMGNDEPVQYGGTGTALSPLETVLGALCGSTGATFATVAREAGFRYDGLNFEASFATDPRSLPAQPGMRPYFHAVRVEIKVRAPRADPRLADVAQLTERRCAVRNLLADAGVTVDLTWHAVAPETPAPGSKASEIPQAPGVHRRP